MKKVLGSAIGILLFLSCFTNMSIISAEVGDMEFIDHGVASPISESRGIIAACDSDKNPIILVCPMDNYQNALRTSLLIIDAKTGEAEQYWYPNEETRNDAVYSLLLSQKNRLYIMPGGYFLEFDIATREWTFAKRVPGETAMSFAEGPDGTIYAATYPNCRLVSYNPETGAFVEHCQLDPTEKYPSYLAVDKAGWVYAGIGTAKSNLVAFNPKTGELKQVAKDSERQTGTGTVYLGTDGRVYGRVSGKSSYYRLYNGKWNMIGGSGLPKAPVKTISWGSMIAEFPYGGRINKISLQERRAEIRDFKGTVSEIAFDYKSEGTSITSLIAGPDGKVYASTSHPMHFIVYDPKEDSLEDWGAIERIGGGNICNFALQGNQIVGCAYAGGFLYAYDLDKPWDMKGSDPNPRLLNEYPGDITRPRTMLAYPDGRNVIMAGFPGYGLVGGGMAIYDLETNKSTLIPNEKIIPGHSTITLGVLPDGNLIGGTSIATPGGGRPVATEGMLYIMDWETKEIIFMTSPLAITVFGNRIAGPEEISSILVGPDGLVYGMANNSRFFVFDPEKKEVLHKLDLKEYGNPPRSDQSFILGSDGKIYILLSNAILRMQPGTFEYEKLATPPQPITAGVALIGDRLYFACGSHLWSYRIPK